MLACSVDSVSTVIPASARFAGRTAAVPYAMAAVVIRINGINDGSMAKSIHDLSPPGSTIRRLREARGWSLADLAAHCVPALERSTVYRIETGPGYTADSLDRIAHALGVSVPDLFLPADLAELALLDPHQRARVLDYARDLADASRYRRS